jgi:uridine kinase
VADVSLDVAVDPYTRSSHLGAEVDLDMTREHRREIIGSLHHAPAERSIGARWVLPFLRALFEFGVHSRAGRESVAEDQLTGAFTGDLEVAVSGEFRRDVAHEHRLRDIRWLGDREAVVDPGDGKSLAGGSLNGGKRRRGFARRMDRMQTRAIESEGGDAPRMLDVDALRDQIGSRGARFVAVDGCGGSGKSTLARELAQGWRQAVVVEMDDFYGLNAERVEVPTVHGGNYDRQRLVKEVLEPLKAGRAGRYQRYDWDEDRLAEWHRVPADAIVLVEGAYSTSELLRGYFDFKIWVETPYDVRLKRGIDRDGEALRSEWVDHWMPAEDRYIEAYRPDEQADLVLDGSGTGAAGVLFKIVDRDQDR